MKSRRWTSFYRRLYINPGDPNHSHYYIWRWYHRLLEDQTKSSHAMAGERGNDITTNGNGFTGNEQYKISSYNRTKKSFTVLVYSMVLQVLDFLRLPFPPPSKMGSITTMNSQRLIFVEKDSEMARNTMSAPLPRILTNNW